MIQHPWTEAQVLDHAARAVGKLDHLGVDGIPHISADEITAMAIALVCVGLMPILPNPADHAFPSLQNT